jgi:hypothetical protein
VRRCGRPRGDRRPRRCSRPLVAGYWWWRWICGFGRRWRSGCWPAAGAAEPPNRPAAEVTASVLVEARRAAGRVQINPAPQEIPWNVLLDVPDAQQRNGRIRAGHER